MSTTTIDVDHHRHLACLFILRSPIALSPNQFQTLTPNPTKGAFDKLDSIYCGFDKVSEKKKKYLLPRAKILNGDLARIINSDEIQSVVRPTKKGVSRAVLKKNPLKNLNVMLKLNPYAKAAKRMALIAENQRIADKANKISTKRSTLSKATQPNFNV